VEIGFLGLAGDRQNNQDLHGGPERAVTLFSLERILALQEEGHRIFPGAAGENITIAGLDWELLEPGVRLRLDEAVLLQVTRFISPCSTIAHVFAGGDYSRISQKRYPGWSRLSACVLQPGSVQVGARVRIV
jgi:MOSC domain-containing protein YiiM